MAFILPIKTGSPGQKHSANATCPLQKRNQNRTLSELSFIWCQPDKHSTI